MKRIGVVHAPVQVRLNVEIVNMDGLFQKLDMMVYFPRILFALFVKEPHLLHVVTVMVWGISKCPQKRIEKHVLYAMELD